MCGKIRADANRRIIQNCPHGRGASAPVDLFGSGSAGLGGKRRSLCAYVPEREPMYGNDQAEHTVADFSQAGLHPMRTCMRGSHGRSTSTPSLGIVANCATLSAIVLRLQRLNDAVRSSHGPGRSRSTAKICCTSARKIGCLNSRKKGGRSRPN